MRGEDWRGALCGRLAEQQLLIMASHNGELSLRPAVADARPLVQVDDIGKVDTTHAPPSVELPSVRRSDATIAFHCETAREPCSPSTRSTTGVWRGALWRVMR
jgi:hypothetical protein